MNEVRSIYNNPCLFATLSFNSSDNLFTSLAVNLDLDAILFNFPKAIFNSVLIPTINNFNFIKSLFEIHNKSFINSLVENTLITDCFFNLASLDQIGQLSFNARAKKSISSGSGQILFAFDKNLEYSLRGTILTKIVNSSNTFLKVSSEIPAFLRISCLYFRSSSIQKEGANNSKISNLDIRFLVVESFLKNENKMLVSITNLIYANPAFLSFSNLPFFNSLPSFMHSLSVSLLFDSILFHLSRSKNLTISILLKASILFASSFSSFLSSLGILTTISGMNDSYIPNLKVFKKRLSLIERWGIEIQRIIDSCQKQNLPIPIFEEYQGFRVIFRKPYAKEELKKLGLNDRQIKAVEYVEKRGLITNREYQKLTLVSRKTATRDLTDLVKRGIFNIVGRGKREIKYTLLLRHDDAKMTQKNSTEDYSKITQKGEINL
jgi:hypothetical protein